MTKPRSHRRLALALSTTVALAIALGPVLEPAARAETTSAMSIKDVWKRFKEELQVYRGNAFERLSNRIAQGRSSFDSKLSVKDNLLRLAEEKRLPHYYADVNGRQVLHVVVEIGKGKESSRALRKTFQRIGKQTIELNYKASNAKNPYGHVAVRVGNDATYDLTGTQGTATLPPMFQKVLNLTRGSKDLSFGRKRNLRRFLEARRDSPDSSSNLYYGLLFGATREEMKETRKLYEGRRKSMTQFNVSGGDAEKGVYSCAQFLTEGATFFNSRGVARSVGAKSTVSAAHRSAALEAVIVYKTPSVTDAQARSALP